MNVIISIDWDHTLRNMEGIDLNLLALVLYAKSKNIPVGLTTHRDLENTTLYTLYYWQYEKPKNESDALAAAISYWDKHLFKPLNITFDFINARYQPRYQHDNYYQEKLFPLEQKLAEEIILNRILDDRDIVQEKIKQYAQVESILEGNEYKETQIRWLLNFFQPIEDSFTLYHVDDNKEVCQHLSKQRSVNAIFYEKSPLFSNEISVELLENIGLLDDMQRLMEHDVVDIFDNQQRWLAVIMAILQMPYINNEIFLIIESVLKKMALSLKLELVHLHDFITRLLIETKRNGHPIWLMPNHLVLTEL